MVKVPAVLSPLKEPMGPEDVWATVTVLAFWRKGLFPAGIRTADHPVRSLTKLFRLYHFEI